MEYYTTVDVDAEMLTMLTDGFEMTITPLSEEMPVEDLTDMEAGKSVSEDLDSSLWTMLENRYKELTESVESANVTSLGLSEYHTHSSLDAGTIQFFRTQTLNCG